MFVFHTGWLSFPDDQRLTVDRLRSQSVPIVIADAGSFDLFARDYAIVNRYLAERYELVAESPFGDDGSVFGYSWIPRVHHEGYTSRCRFPATHDRSHWFVTPVRG